jgi:hypothetical protein
MDYSPDTISTRSREETRAALADFVVFLQEYGE